VAALREDQSANQHNLDKHFQEARGGCCRGSKRYDRMKEQRKSNPWKVKSCPVEFSARLKVTW